MKDLMEVNEQTIVCFINWCIVCMGKLRCQAHGIMSL